MGRPTYTITDADYAAARLYIENAMSRQDISTSFGYMEYRGATTAVSLQSWCDDYLNADMFKKLKAAVLAARKRARDYKSYKAKKGVDLDHLAHLRLSALANELGLSLSDTILVMNKAYDLAKDNGLM